MLEQKTRRTWLRAELVLYLLHVICICFFPNPTPAHWTDTGVVDLYISKWCFLLIDGIPFVVIYLLLLNTSYYTNTMPWKLLATVGAVLFTAVTWIPELLIFSGAANAKTVVQMLTAIAQIVPWILAVVVLVLLGYSFIVSQRSKQK